MSDTFIRLVHGLAPSAATSTHGTAAPRDRFLLFTLAYLADEDGSCTVSLGQLQRITHHAKDVIRQALRNLERHGLIIYEGDTHAARTYRFNRPALEAEQFVSKIADRDSLDRLLEYGLPVRALNALSRGTVVNGQVEVITVNTLGKLVAEYRALPGQEQTGFHRYLGIRGIGVTVGRQVLDAYDAWHSGQHPDCG